MHSLEVPMIGAILMMAIHRHKVQQTQPQTQQNNNAWDPFAINDASVQTQGNGTVFCGTKTHQIVQFEKKSEDASVIMEGHDGQIWSLYTLLKEAMFATGGCHNGYEFCSRHWSNDGNILAFGTENTFCLYTLYT